MNSVYLTVGLTEHGRLLCEHSNATTHKYTHAIKLLDKGRKNIRKWVENIIELMTNTVSKLKPH